MNKSQFRNKAVVMCMKDVVTPGDCLVSVA